MAKVTDIEGITHLNGDVLTTLCGEFSANADKRISADLTCPKCARMVLTAIELSTKVERRAWRKL